jgi:hypothetical protein
VRLQSAGHHGVAARKLIFGIVLTTMIGMRKMVQLKTFAKRNSFNGLARDLSMTEQIANSHQANARAN